MQAAAHQQLRIQVYHPQRQAVSVLLFHHKNKLTNVMHVGKSCSHSFIHYNFFLLSSFSPIYGKKSRVCVKIKIDTI
jgi:hypothetical protein